MEDKCSEKLIPWLARAGDGWGSEYMAGAQRRADVQSTGAVIIILGRMARIWRKGFRFPVAEQEFEASEAGKVGQARRCL